MKILVFTSRYTAGRDIISEDFGRQVRLFENLRKFGHEIDFFCVDYKKLENRNTSLHNMRIFIRSFRRPRLFSLLRELKKTIDKNDYDLMIATSDPLWGVLGYFIARKYKIKFLYDIQDNYLLYESYRIPLFGMFERHVTRNADLVICASNVLTDEVKKIRKNKTLTIPNGADTKLFRPLSKSYARKTLKLPADAKIISYIGSIQKLHGVDILIKAFEELRKEIKDANLLIVGKVINPQKENFDFSREGIIYLGSVLQKKVILAINASDVLVVPYPKNSFTKYMLAPYKLVEFLACNRPIVITNAGEMHKNIKDKRMVARAGSTEDLKKKIKYALSLDNINSRPIALKFDWKNIASRLNEAVRMMG